MSGPKLSAYEFIEMGFPTLAYQAYLEQQELTDSELSYPEFEKKFLSLGGDLEGLRSNPRKAAYFGLCKILGPLLPKSLQDQHDYFDPARIEAEDYEEFKKKILSTMAPDAGPASREKYQRLLLRESYDFLFQNLYRRAHQTVARRRGASEDEATVSPDGQRFDGEQAKALLSQLECEFREIENNPVYLQEEALEKLTQLLGPLVPALLRASDGALDPSKVKAESFAEFKEFLRTQASVDGIAFNGFWLDSYKKVLGKEEFEPLLKALYQKSRGEVVEEIDEDLLQQFTGEIVQVSAERFVQHHLNQRDGRQMLRGILGDPSHYTKEIRCDVVKAIASVGESQGVAGHARYHALTNNISTWNYFNISVTDEELNNAARIADGILDGAEYMEKKAEQAQRLQQEAPEQLWVLEEAHAGRKISPEDIKKIQKLIVEKEKQADPLSQAQVKLAKFWLMTVDNQLWGSGGPMELGVHRGYLFKRTEALLKQTDAMASEAEFLRLNEELQNFLHGALNSEDSPTWNWVKDKTVGHGLPEVFERMPAPLKNPYEELKQFSEEIEYARAMGQRFRLDGIHAPSGDPQVDEAAIQFIYALQQTERSLWYGYKQHKLLSRGGSQVANVIGLGDVAEIREANKVIDGMIFRLQGAKSKQDIEKELELLHQQLDADGALHQALVAAEMDGFEQILGLGQTIAVIAGITLATKGTGTSAAVAKAAEAAQAINWTARTAWGLKMGAAISFAENGLAITSGEVRQGEDTLLMLAKDSAATSIAMGIFSPFGARMGHSLEQNLLKRLMARYTEGGLKQGALHFAGDTALEAGEEVFDATLRGTLDGKPEISFDQFREIGMVSLAGGGAKMGSVVSGFRNSQQTSYAKTFVPLENDPANDNALLEQTPSAPVLKLPNRDAAKWAAAAAGIVTLLSPEIANATSDVGSRFASQGFGPEILTALGLGTLGILGMAHMGKREETLLRQMDEELLALQVKNPEDPAILNHWQVIADQLLARGDPRGEWIQLELARERLRESGDPKNQRKNIKARCAEIENEMVKDIHQRFGAIIHIKFNVPVGFFLKVSRADNNQLNPVDFLKRIFESEYALFIRGLVIDQFELAPEQVHWIVSSEKLSHLTSLILMGNGIGEAGARAIAESQTLSRLTSLDLIANGIRNAGARAIAESQSLNRLTSLNLRATLIDEAGARAIAESQTLSHLTTLNLDSNDIGDVGARAIAESQTLNHLTSLELQDNGIDEAGTRAIAESQTLSHLTSLNLGSNYFGDAGARAIAESQTLSHLTSLNLWRNEIGDAGARALAESQTLSRLTSFDLGRNRIGTAGVRAIAESQTLSRLTSLYMYGNSIGGEGAGAIAESQTLSRLTSLDLSWNVIGDAGARAIAESQTLSHLTSLILQDNRIGDAGARAIAESQTLSHLTSLMLLANNISDARYRAIAASPNLPHLKVFDGKEIERPPAVNKPPDPSGGTPLAAFAAPALLGLDFLLNGQPTLTGMLLTGLATAAGILGMAVSRKGKKRGKRTAEGGKHRKVFENFVEEIIESFTLGKRLKKAAADYRQNNPAEVGKDPAAPYDERMLQNFRLAILEHVPEGSEAVVAEKVRALDAVLQSYPIDLEDAYMGLVVALGKAGYFKEAERILREGKVKGDPELQRQAVELFKSENIEPNENVNEWLVRSQLAIAAFHQGGLEREANPLYQLSFLKEADWYRTFSEILLGFAETGRLSEALSRFDQFARAVNPQDVPPGMVARMRDVLTAALIEHTSGGMGEGKINKEPGGESNLNALAAPGIFGLAYLLNGNQPGFTGLFLGLAAFFIGMAFSRYKSLFGKPSRAGKSADVQRVPPTSHSEPWDYYVLGNRTESEFLGEGREIAEMEFGRGGWAQSPTVLKSENLGPFLTIGIHDPKTKTGYMISPDSSQDLEAFVEDLKWRHGDLSGFRVAAFGAGFQNYPLAYPKETLLALREEVENLLRGHFSKDQRRIRWVQEGHWGRLYLDTLGGEFYFYEMAEDGLQNLEPTPLHRFQSPRTPLEEWWRILKNSSSLEELAARFRLNQGQNTDILRALLKDEDQDVRYKAALLLKEEGGREAIPDFLALLKDKDPHWRRTALMFLLDLQAKEATEDIRGILKNDDDDEVKMFAIDVLAQLGATEAIDDLKPFMAEERSIDHQGWAGFRFETLLKIKGARDAKAYLKDETPLVRLSAIKVLWDMNALHEAEEDLRLLLEDENPLVSFSASQALSKLSKTKAIEGKGEDFVPGTPTSTEEIMLSDDPDPTDPADPGGRGPSSGGAAPLALGFIPHT